MPDAACKGLPGLPAEQRAQPRSRKAGQIAQLRYPDVPREVLTDVFQTFADGGRAAGNLQPCIVYSLGQLQQHLFVYLNALRGCAGAARSLHGFLRDAVYIYDGQSSDSAALRARVRKTVRPSKGSV